MRVSKVVRRDTVRYDQDGREASERRVQVALGTQGHARESDEREREKIYGKDNQGQATGK